MKLVAPTGLLIPRLFNNDARGVKLLVLTLFISSASFGQLNNCINTKEHPLILEIKDSIKVNNIYMSVLAYAVVKGDRLGLSNSKILNLAYAWAACKKISNPVIRKEEESRFLRKVLSDEEFERLLSCVGKLNREKK